ncbi:MAG: hypothetical protein ACK40Z_12565 [Dietzia sp.]
MTRTVSAALVALFAAAQIGCSPGSTEPPDGGSVVSESGLDYSSDVVTVSAPQGVAPPGTELKVRPTNSPLPGEWGDFASPVGSAVEITLGGDLQPERPLTIDFVTVPREETTFVLTEHDGEVEILPRGDVPTLVTQTSHLSTFWPITFDIGTFTDKAVDAVAQSLKVSSPKPGCYRPDGLHTEADIYISTWGDDAAWPCVTRNGSNATLSLHSNSGVAWLVSTSPQWTTALPDTLDLPTVVTASAWQRTGLQYAQNNALLLPGSTTNLTTSDFEDTRVTMEVDPAVSQLRAVTLALSIFLPDKLAESMTRASCAADLLTGASTGTASGTVTASIASCLGSVVQGAAGEIVGILADGAGALWAQIDGLIRTATMNDDVVLDVAGVPTDVDPGDPIDLASVESMVGTWSGPVVQNDSGPYSVTMTLGHDGRSLFGTVEYPELQCSGYLHGARMEDGVVKIHETINRNGSCVVEVDLELALRGDRLAYYFGPRTNTVSEGTASLTRVD